MTIAFFHQNPVHGVQGGIERYIATLLSQGKGRCVLIAEKTDNDGPNELGLPFTVPEKFPRWMRFACAVRDNVKAVRAFLREKGVTVMEFSRPEYACFAALFRGKKVFTFHGTGPSFKEPVRYLIHGAACSLLPIVADEIHVVGRDDTGMPWLVRKLLKKKTRFIDAWYDTCFLPVPYPTLDGPIKVFYAGRLAKMKNPELLYAIVRQAKQTLGDRISFFYFGGDGHEIPEDLRNVHMADRGLLSAEELAKAIGTCHMGLLCSGYGEGSPFVVVEALACGRGYVLPPLPGLRRMYEKQPGIRIAPDYAPESYLRGIEALFAELKKSDPYNIAASVVLQSKERAAETILERLMELETLSQRSPKRWL